MMRAAGQVSASLFCSSVEAGREHTLGNMRVRALLRGLSGSSTGQRGFSSSAAEKIPAITGTRTHSHRIDRRERHPFELPLPYLHIQCIKVSISCTLPVAAIAWFPLPNREVRKDFALAPPSAPACKRYVETTTMAQPRALPKVETNPTFLRMRCAGPPTIML